MSHPPPVPLNYSGPMQLPPRKFRWKLFFLAFAIGTIISGITWIGGWHAIDQGNAGFLIIVIPLVKITAATIMVCFRKYRSAGIGVFVSIPVGFAIFFSASASNLNFH